MASYSDGPDVVDLCARYGLTLDPWQRTVLEVGLGRRDDDSWAASTVAVSASRQSGKGCLIEARALAGVLLFGEKTIACSAHEARTTRLSFERVLAYLENFDELRRRVGSVQRWVGREQIRLRDGSLIVFPARSRGALRGYTCDALILDEAQYLTDAQYEAVLPTLSARPNTQVWQLGTVPTHLGDGEVFARVRQAALGGADDRLAYLEWSADPGCDLDDRGAWAQANPALGQRISIEAIATERRELSDEGFARERLGLWPVDRREYVVAPDVWAGLAGVGPEADVPPTALGVDRSPDGLAVVAACWLDGDGGQYVELVHAQAAVTDLRSTFEWLVARAGRRIPVVVDAASTASALYSELVAAKCNVKLTSVTDMCRACAGWIDDVHSGRLGHADQPVLTAALEGARRRPVGTAGAFGWDRSGAASISPLVAATLARFGAVSGGRRRTGGAIFV
jgi:hypothetical protein